MKITEIAEQPTVVFSTHESVFRAYHILNKVLEMIERGDSKETIFEVVEMLKASPSIEIKLNYS